MPRSTGIGRTGKKHKRVKFECAAEEEPKENSGLATLEAAVAAAEVAVQVAEGDDEAVREWLDGVLKQVENQESKDELELELERRRHDRYIGAGIACVEAVKRRTFQRMLSGRQRTLLEPFLDAWEQNRNDWQFMYPADQCDKCGCHLALCKCLVTCSKCGQIVPRRAWQLLACYPIDDMCACEKISNITVRLCGRGSESEIDLGLF